MELLYGFIYFLYAERLETFWKYIIKNIKNGRIILFTSPAGFFLLFIPQDNGILRLYINHKGFN